LPTKCKLQVGSLSTAFLTSLALASFLSEVKRIFINFLTAHYNLGSSRATPSYLEGFTFKSNKCHKDCFTKLNAQMLTKRILSTHHLGFLTNHKILTKRGWGSSQRVRMSVFRGWHQQPLKEGGRSFYTCPPKTSRWKLASKNWNIQF
jgi:hypothetical protein